MDINDFISAGNDIVDVVNDAVRSNDYSKLSDTIQKTVNDVTEAAKKDVRYGAYGKGSSTGRTVRTEYQYRRTGNTVHRSVSSGEPRPGVKYKYKDATPFLQKNISKSEGNGLMGMGFFGVFVGISTFIDGLSNIANNGMEDLLIGAAFLAASAFALYKGNKKKKLVKRYHRYGEIAGDAQYIEIEELAQRTGSTKEEVLKDIKEMMKLGYLNQAWLDEQETTLMLTREIYEQYKEIRNGMAQTRREAQREEAEADRDGLSREVRELLQEGSGYIRTIHQFNDAIPDAEMTDKLSRLEMTMNRIMEQVRKNPESAAELRRLMNYYLPTTMKLLGAYKELDRQPSTGENVMRTKREIEGALDTINDAFEKLLDDLFQHMAWDISSDISVMETMMKQDGLTGQEMRAQEDGAAGAGSEFDGAESDDLWSDTYTSTLSFGDESTQVQYKK